MKNVPVSLSSLTRLPQYLRVIEENKNMEYISASFIAKELKLNPIQVRKDIELISSLDGKPGLGFDTKIIKKELEEYLCLNYIKDAILVGAGKLGQALLNYDGFKDNLNILMAFDIDEKKCNQKNIFNINQMEKMIKKMNIKIGIITVPKESAQDVCDRMISSGIKAIWNFAPINLNVPNKIIIKNEDLMTSALILLNRFKNS